MKCLWVLIVTVCLAGCTGSRCHVSAERIQYPVSATAVVFDGNGQPCPGSSLEKVGDLKLRYRSWSTLFAIVPLHNRNVDISDELQQAIESRGGDAIINLSAKATDHWYWYFSTLIPVMPVYMTVDITGDIVRLKRAS